MVVWNLMWPALKPHDNVVLPHHSKSITRQFNLQIIPRLCCTFCSFLLHCWQITCWTKNKLQRKTFGPPVEKILPTPMKEWIHHSSAYASIHKAFGHNWLFKHVWKNTLHLPVIVLSDRVWNDFDQAKSFSSKFTFLRSWSIPETYTTNTPWRIFISLNILLNTIAVMEPRAYCRETVKRHDRHAVLQLLDHYDVFGEKPEKVEKTQETQQNHNFEVLGTFS